MVYNKKYSLIFFLILLAEVLSFSGYLWPNVNKIGFVVICLATIWLAVKNLRYALLLVLAELIIGSKGYLFFFEFNGTTVSIRIALWLIVMGFWLTQTIILSFRPRWTSGEKSLQGNTKDMVKGSLLRQPADQNDNKKNGGDKKRGWRWPNLLPDFTYAKYFYVLMLAVAWGLIMALFRGNDFSNIFFDINNWFYLALIFPLAQIFGKKDNTPRPVATPLTEGNNWQKLLQVFTAGCLWLAVETAGLLFYFSHTANWGETAIYRWLRVSGVGEVTSMGSGFVRVFFQSHVYLVLALCLLWPVIIKLIKQTYFKHTPASGHPSPSYAKAMAGKQEGNRGLWLAWWLATAGLTIVLIGQSRSFWVGLIVALAVLIIYLLKGRPHPNPLLGKERGEWRVWLKFAGLAIMSAVASLLIMTALVKLPGLGAWNALSQRTNLDESAVSSRWNLIPKLWQAIKVAPITGQGFGKTIVYQSSDPRVLEQSADGTYETYAFEWGWLDIWLKMGLLGVLTYLLLLIKLIRDSLTHRQIGLVLCLTALAVIHFFTPYLNHPLGLGAVMLIAVWLNNEKARS